MGLATYNPLEPLTSLPLLFVFFSIHTTGRLTYLNHSFGLSFVRNQAYFTVRINIQLPVVFCHLLPTSTSIGSAQAPQVHCTLHNFSIPFLCLRSPPSHQGSSRRRSTSLPSPRWTILKHHGCQGRRGKWDHSTTRFLSQHKSMLLDTCSNLLWHRIPMATTELGALPTGKHLFALLHPTDLRQAIVPKLLALAVFLPYSRSFPGHLLSV
jgi:hypothetical protein